MPAPVVCGCAGCMEWRAVHARLCPERPRHVRLAEREADRAAQRAYEHAEAPVAAPRGVA